MLGIILIILGVIGKIVQIWLVIPNSIIKSLLLVGGVAVTIQLIITLIIVKKLDRDFL